MNLFKLKYYGELFNISMFVVCVYLVIISVVFSDAVRFVMFLGLGLYNLYNMLYHNDTFAELMEKWKK